MYLDQTKKGIISLYKKRLYNELCLRSSSKIEEQSLLFQDWLGGNLLEGKKFKSRTLERCQGRYGGGKEGSLKVGRSPLPQPRVSLNRV